jgi:hypothetical protein
MDKDNMQIYQKRMNSAIWGQSGNSPAEMCHCRIKYYTLYSAVAELVYEQQFKFQLCNKHVVIFGAIIQYTNHQSVQMPSHVPVIF